MKKFGGFTLAEVLITLGIIGVVAAMTMPTLINQTNGAQYKAAYKKALSAISQGVTLNVALDDISFADTKSGTAGSTAAPTGGTSVASLLASRMNVVNPTTSAGYTLPSTGLYPEGKAPDTYLFFNDSSMFAFKNAQDGTNCTMSSSTSANNTGCYGFIDVNGAKGPNKVVSCDNGTTAFDTYSAGVKTSADACNVTSPTDIYPVIYYDQTILPVTNAGTAVLYGK
ncbi:prepilin-type N-terminal cleavage/methylation domain-containing protein [bacterium]|nr:prepilin-type N-terminal cleavage/methylation domain-containing protein [bacterium]